MANQPQDRLPKKGPDSKAVINMPGASDAQVRINDVVFKIRPAAVMSAHFRVVLNEAQDWMDEFTRGADSGSDEAEPTLEELRVLAASEKPLACSIVDVMFAKADRERAKELVADDELTFGQLFAVMVRAQAMYNEALDRGSEETGVPPTR